MATLSYRIFFLALLLSPALAQADTGPRNQFAKYPIDCGVLPLTGEEDTDIAMSSEHVIIDVYHTFIKVDATFWFKGGATDQIAFPLGFPEKWLRDLVMLDYSDDEYDEDLFTSDIEEPISSDPVWRRAGRITSNKTIVGVLGSEFGAGAGYDHLTSGTRKLGAKETKPVEVPWETKASHPLLLAAFPELFPGVVPDNLLRTEPERKPRSVRYTRNPPRARPRERVPATCTLSGQTGRRFGPLSDNNDAMPPFDSLPMVGFEAFADGAPIPVRRETMTAACGPRNLKHESVWWLFEADFAAGQTVEIRVVYYQALVLYPRSGNTYYRNRERSTCTGGSSRHQLVFPFFYWLRSGAFWQGPIGRALIEVRPHGLGSDALCCGDEARDQLADGTLVFEWEEFEPEWGLDCRLLVTAAGVARATSADALDDNVPQSFLLLNRLAWLDASEKMMRDELRPIHHEERLLAFVDALHRAADHGDTQTRELALIILSDLLQTLEPDQNEKESHAVENHDQIVAWLWPWVDTQSLEEWRQGHHPTTVFGTYPDTIRVFGPHRDLRWSPADTALRNPARFLPLAWAAGPGMRSTRILIISILLTITFLILVAVALIFRRAHAEPR